MVESIRSFIAFDMDSEPVLKKIVEVQNMLINTGADLKLVEPQNIHITIRFLGNISPTTVDKIYEGMKKVRFTPFDAKIKDLGAFPKPQYAKVLWVGMTEGAEQMRSVFNQLEPHVRGLGFPPDRKGFSPHLTIARVRSGRNRVELSRSISENANYDFGVVRASCLRLKKSDLTPTGPIYSILREFCPEK